MDLSTKHKQMLTLANECWQRFRIGSVQQLADWQDDHYIPAKELAVLEARTDRNQTDETRLAIHGLTGSFQIIHSLLDNVRHDLQRLRDDLEHPGDTTIEGLKYPTPLVAPMALWLPSMLVSAFNPTGRREYMPQAQQLGLDAAKALIDQSRKFALKDADTYVDFACKALVEYLPKEYMRILDFELQIPRGQPSSKVDAGEIEPATRSIIQQIGRGRASGE